MSLEIIATMTCDTCGETIISEPVVASTRAKQACWQVGIEADRQGWKTINRGRYHTPTHYCRACLDKPMKPVPKRKLATS